MDKEKKTYANQRYMELIEKMIDEIKYGQITITVQDEQIVQVEQNKKIRLR